MIETKQKGTLYYIFFQLLALLMVILWGSSFISTKYLLNQGLNPSQIYILRFGIAYVCLLVVTYKSVKIGPFRDEILFFFCGLTGGSIYFIAENIALEMTLVSNVGIIVTTAPLLTALVTKILYRKEHIGRGIILGSIIAFLGVTFVIFNSQFEISISPIGDFLSLLAALSWAFYSVTLKKISHKYSVLTFTRKVFFYGILTSIPFAFLIHSNSSMHIFVEPWIVFNLVFLGIGASMGAYLIWNRMVKEIGAVKSSNYLYLSPLITLIASVIFLDERITLIGAIGCSMILAGVIVGGKYRG